MSFQSKSRKIAVIRNIFIYTDFSYFTHACYLPHTLFLLTGIFLPNAIPPDSHVLCVCVTHWGLLQLPVQTWVVSWRMGTYEWPHLWRKWLPLLQQSLTATVPQEEWDCVSAFPFCDEMLTCPICTGLMPITNSTPHSLFLALQLCVSALTAVWNDKRLLWRRLTAVLIRRYKHECLEVRLAVFGKRQ